MPTSFKSDFLTTLSTRGFIHQCTDFTGLDEVRPFSPVISAVSCLYLRESPAYPPLTGLQQGVFSRAGISVDVPSIPLQAAASGPVSAYLGFDATAPSLHVGSLLQIMILRHLQKTGHKPVVLMGGGTTKVRHHGPRCHWTDCLPGQRLAWDATE
jgi:hypothetical protein